MNQSIRAEVERSGLFCRFALKPISVISAHRSRSVPLVFSRLPLGSSDFLARSAPFSAPLQCSGVNVVWVGLLAVWTFHERLAVILITEQRDRSDQPAALTLTLLTHRPPAHSTLSPNQHPLSP